MEDLREKPLVKVQTSSRILLSFMGRPDSKTIKGNSVTYKGSFTSSYSHPVGGYTPQRINLSEKGLDKLVEDFGLLDIEIDPANSMKKMVYSFKGRDRLEATVPFGLEIEDRIDKHRYTALKLKGHQIVPYIDRKGEEREWKHPIEVRLANYHDSKSTPQGDSEDIFNMVIGGTSSGKHGLAYLIEVTARTEENSWELAESIYELLAVHYSPAGRDFKEYLTKKAEEE